MRKPRMTMGWMVLALLAACSSDDTTETTSGEVTTGPGATSSTTGATGGSGHALKFAPLLGDIIADATLDAPSPWRARFSWRRSAEAVAQRSADAARFTGS